MELEVARPRCSSVARLPTLYLRIASPTRRRNVASLLPLAGRRGGAVRWRASPPRKAPPGGSGELRQKERCARRTTGLPGRQPCYHCLAAGVAKVVDRRSAIAGRSDLGTFSSRSPRPLAAGHPVVSAARSGSGRRLRSCSTPGSEVEGFAPYSPGAEGMAFHE